MHCLFKKDMEKQQLTIIFDSSDIEHPLKVEKMKPGQMNFYHKPTLLETPERQCIWMVVCDFDETQRWQEELLAKCYNYEADLLRQKEREFKSSKDVMFLIMQYNKEKPDESFAIIEEVEFDVAKLKFNVKETAVPYSSLETHLKEHEFIKDHGEEGCVHCVCKKEDLAKTKKIMIEFAWNLMNDTLTKVREKICNLLVMKTWDWEDR